MILNIAAAILLQIALPYPGPGVPSTASSFVQAVSCQGVSATNCTTSAISVTSGHALVFCSELNATGTLSSLTISTGTNNLASFIQLFTPQQISSTSLDCRYLLSTNATGSTTFNATWSVGGHNMILIVYELNVINGLDGTAPTPVGTFVAGQTVVNCPSYTTTHAGALVICAGLATSGISSATASSGFTIPSGGSVTTAGVGSNGAMEYQAKVAAGTALTPSITITSSSGTYGASFAFY